MEENLGMEREITIQGRKRNFNLVAQSILAYTMSCFLIPDFLCHNLTQMLVNFWWGYNSDKKKIHGLRWERHNISWRH